MIRFKKEHIPIYLLYILFGFGGLWHALHLFQETMRIMASPLLITVSIYLVYIVLKSIHDSSKNRFLFWCCIVLTAGWVIEYLGLRTHFPFGHYRYGEVLQPQFVQVPLAIGFSWLTICLSSLVISCRIICRTRIQESFYPYIIPLLSAIFMFVFDVIMEHAALRLDYWAWQDHIIPVQNYMSWFVLGVFFTWAWFKLKVSMKSLSGFGVHVYLSQLLYFILVLFKL